MKNISLFTLLFLLVTSILSSCQKETIIEKEIVRDTVVLIDTLDLDRPIGLSISKGLYSTKISISWEAMPLAKKYEVWKFDNTLKKYALLREVQANSIEDLAIEKALTKVFYKVRTVDEANKRSRFSDADFGYTSAFNYNLISSFGSEGNGIAQFNFPKYVEIDKNRNIYVSDDGANRVLKFDPQGNYLSLFYSGSGARAIAFFSNGDYVATRTQSSSYIQVFSANGQLLKQWGTYGTGDSNFANVEQVTIDNDDNIWIVDGINDRVKKYNRNGDLLFILGKTGKDKGEFTTPMGVCYFNNKIFVTDIDNRNVQVFDKTGKYLKTWSVFRPYHGIKTDGKSLFVAVMDRVVKSDEDGDVQEEIGLNTFSYATDVALRTVDELLVCDYYARKIFIFKKI